MLSLIYKKYIIPYVSIIVYASLGFSLTVIKLRRNKDFTSDLKTFIIPGGYTIPLLSSLFILWFLYHLSEDTIIAIGLFIIILTIAYFLINSKIIRRLTKN